MRTLIALSPTPHELRQRRAAVLRDPVARAFEANVEGRVKDPAGQVLAQGFTTATLGTSIVWGAFGVRIALPAPRPTKLRSSVPAESARRRRDRPRPDPRHSAEKIPRRRH